MTQIVHSEGANPADASRIAQHSSDPRLMRAQGISKPELDAILSELQGLPYETRAHLFSTRGGHGVSALFGLAPGSVHIPTGLPNQFNLFENRECIADIVLPVVSVNKKSDKIWGMDPTTLQQIANTQIAGSRARPGEVPYSVNSNLSYACVDQGLVDFIDYQTIANADAPIEPYVISATVIKQFLDLAREYRVANVVFNSANYGANVDTLSGSSRWDQASSDPVAALLAAKEQVFSTPNVLVIGGQVWPKLRTNPNVLKYILGRAGTSSGSVPDIMVLNYLAEILEVERVVVGRAKYVTSQEAGTSTSYLWGKAAALLRVENNPNPKMTQTFGYTYRFGGKSYRSEVIPDRMPGQMGGEYLKMTHSDAETVVGGATCGYFFDTVIS